MRVRVQQEQKFLVTTKPALWRYDNAFIFTNQSEVDFGITLVDVVDTLCKKHDLEDALITEILTVNKIIITQNYFSFREKTYPQMNGLAMGAPTSSILSEIYLQHLEKY